MMMEASLLHHVGIVLSVLGFLSYIGRCCGPVAYFLAFFYLCLVHERYTMRLWRKLQFQARKQANQKRLLSDSESVNWLNHAIAKVWPICMENVASQQFLLPIIPWFLDKYKPWTAKKAVVQHLCLGKSPPLITEMRVLGQSAADDHLVLELGLNFLSGNDMSAILAVKLRKRLGFGLWTKMHVTGMHIEGKVLVGVKFLDKWPFLSRIRLSFVGPPYFQMTAKPIFQHGLDVTELPGIAGWLDKILSVAFEQSLVEPNMLVVDVEKFVSAPTEPWFKVDEKPPIAHAKVEIMEGADMKPSDMNGLADPYVKGQLGPHRFRTKTQKKTLNPKWLEEFMIPINSWEASNILVLEVRDKDTIFDDTLGDCTVNISELKAGQRHDRWLPLQNIKMGRLHLALTIIEGADNKEHPKEADSLKLRKSNDEDGNRCSQNNTWSENESKSLDELEPIPVQGSEKTGVWVHRPGDIVSQKWESRKGRVRQGNTKIQCTDVGSSSRSAAARFQCSDTNISEENQDEKKTRGNDKIWKGLRAIGSMFHSNNKNDEGEAIDERAVDLVPTPRPNIRAAGDKCVRLNLVVDGVKAGDLSELQTELSSNNQVSEKAAYPDNSGISPVKKGIFRQAGKILKKSFKKGRGKKDEEEETSNSSQENSRHISSNDSPPSSSPSRMVEGISMLSSYDNQLTPERVEDKSSLSGATETGKLSSPKAENIAAESAVSASITERAATSQKGFF